MALVTFFIVWCHFQQQLDLGHVQVAQLRGKKMFHYYLIKDYFKFNLIFEGKENFLKMLPDKTFVGIWVWNQNRRQKIL
jgi:hypothetical protein